MERNEKKNKTVHKSTKYDLDANLDETRKAVSEKGKQTRTTTSVEKEKQIEKTTREKKTDSENYIKVKEYARRDRNRESENAKTKREIWNYINESRRKKTHTGESIRSEGIDNGRMKESWNEMKEK